MKTLRLGACTLAVVAGPTAFVACGGTTIVDVTEYEQSCQEDSECVVVQDGDICCGCPNAAINRSDLDRFQGDLGSCSAQCDIACTEQPLAFCNEGTCDTRVPSEQVCQPGDQIFCKCMNGMDSTKTCDAKGQAFGECDCP